MPVDKIEYARRMRMIDRAFVLLTFLFFCILISFMVLLINVRHISHKAVGLSKENALLLKENQRRVIQTNQFAISACKHTYSGIEDVFQIFFVKKNASKAQIAAQKKFSDRIDELQKTCIKPQNH